MIYKYSVTIFTPTYNRAYLIENLYYSLKKQTCKDFEWIIIDDGSTDKTNELINRWIFEESSFEITYICVKNGGKHRAINRGTDIARGKLFFIVDSDDYLIDTAVEDIIRWEDTLIIKENFAGISGNKGDSERGLIGKTFKGEYVDATSLEREKYNIEGDKAEVFYTAILKKYKFPEFEGENFITENVVWLAIANDGYKIRWFNKVIYIAQYLRDGLTYHAQEIAKKNPKGYALYYERAQKYYNNYFLKEKEELFGDISHLLIDGEIKKINQLLENSERFFAKDESFILLKYRILIYEGKIHQAIDYLEQGRISNPKSIKIIEKLEEIYTEAREEKKLINLYQDYLYVVEDDSKRSFLIGRLMSEFKIESDEIRFIAESKLKGLIDEKKIEEAVNYFLSNRIFDSLLKEELQFYSGNDYLQLFILFYYFKEVIGYPVQLEYSAYLYGHTYYLYKQYDKSKAEYLKIPKDLRSPLVKDHLLKIEAMSAQD